MLICRCAWHQQYYGHRLWSGVISWRGWSVRFTDGICPRCLARFRTEYRTLLERRERDTKPTATTHTPRRSAVA